MLVLLLHYVETIMRVEVIQAFRGTIYKAIVAEGPPRPPTSLATTLGVFIHSSALSLYIYFYI